MKPYIYGREHLSPRRVTFLERLNVAMLVFLLICVVLAVASAIGGW